MRKKIFYFVSIFVLLSGVINIGYSLEITNIIGIEKKRIRKNRLDNANLDKIDSVAISGDKFVFNLGLDFLGSKQSLKTKIEFIQTWSNPIDPTSCNYYWNDVSYLYRYFASLQAQELLKNKELPDSLKKYIIPYEQASHEFNFKERIKKIEKKENMDFFNYRKFRLDSKSEILNSKNQIKKRIVFYKKKEIGFLIDGDKLKLDFIFEGKNKINHDELNKKYNKIIADFPLPMHTGGGKLIELGIEKGEIINYIFSGGKRRSGMIIINKDGSSYPSHIQRFWDKTDSKYLDISHNYLDLKRFIEITEEEDLSVVMEMMLLDNLDGLDLRPIGNVSENGGRRMLVWKNQYSSSPSLLVLNNGLDTNQLTWVASNLGYKWGIYCDVNYFDDAGYWIEGSERKRFSYYEENKKSFHRMILYVE